MDCSGSFGNYGCNGGLMENAFKYVKSVGGIASESDYPYKPRVCGFKSLNLRICWFYQHVAYLIDDLFNE